MEMGNKLRVICRSIFVALIFIGLGLTNIGSCGDSGDGSGNVGGGGSGGGGLTPVCNIPPLDTGFSDKLFFFLDLDQEPPLEASITGTGEFIFINIFTLTIRAIPQPLEQ